MTLSGTNPTMKDVAREAGVALGTVSKVVNGLPVSESYRVRVEEAIEKLNYRVNSYAKGLRSNKTYQVAVMVPNLMNPFFARLVNSINRSLAARKHRMLLYATDYDPQQEQEYVLLAEQQRVDGVICLSYNPDLQVPSSLPMISIDRSFSTQIPCVSSDNYGGGRLAAEMLVAGGCRNLAFMRIGSKLTNEPNKRKDGFISACEALDVPYTLKIIDDGTPFAAFEEFLREHMHGDRFDFDGIFCVTDALAYQICRSLKSMGLRVPEDVQVIGFDGIRQFGDLELCCSTIVQPVDEIAETCITMLLEQSLAQTPSLVCLPVHYAWGGTTRIRENA